MPYPNSESTRHGASAARLASPDARTTQTPGQSAHEALVEKRRLLLIVRTGLTLALGYLLIFSSSSPSPPPAQIAFIACYLGSNLVIALMPLRIFARAGFDIGLILIDTAAISSALLLIPD